MAAGHSNINSARVLELKKTGLSQRAIAERLGLSENTISRILKRHAAAASGAQKPAPKSE